MRCPKCGAFMEDTRDVCFMCGTNVKTYNPANSNASVNQQQAGGFPTNGDYSQIYNSVKKEDSDIFDFFSDHKGLIRFVGFVLLVGVLFLAGSIYYKVKSKETPLKAQYGQLYYNADPDIYTSTGTQGYFTYGTKGAQSGSPCSIKVQAAENTSSDFIYTLTEELKTSIEPKRDLKYNVVDSSTIYTLVQGEMVVNDINWSYINVYYPKSTSTTLATALKQRVLATVYNGFAYTVNLENTKNDDKCLAALDNFERSLQFLPDAEFAAK